MRGRLPGNLLERVDGDVARLGRLLSDLLPELAANLLMAAGIVVVLWFEDWRVGAAVAAFAVVGAVVVDRVRALGVPRFVRSRAASAAFFGRLSEWLAAAEELRPLGGQRYLRASFERTWRTGCRARWPPRSPVMRCRSPTRWCSSAGWRSAERVGRPVPGRVTDPGHGVAGVPLQRTDPRPLSALRAEMQQLQQAQAALIRIDELLAEQNAAHCGTALLPAGACSLEFDRVRHSYVDGAPVLRGVNFALPEGAVLGMVGSTGSGKSTIARLLSRMIELQEGDIQLGGVSVRELAAAHLRRRVAVLPQETEIMPGSVRDNCALFDESVSADAVAGTFERLGAGTWLRQLRMEWRRRSAPADGSCPPASGNWSQSRASSCASRAW